MTVLHYARKPHCHKSKYPLANKRSHFDIISTRHYKKDVIFRNNTYARPSLSAFAARFAISVLKLNMKPRDTFRREQNCQTIFRE